MGRVLMVPLDKRSLTWDNAHDFNQTFGTPHGEKKRTLVTPHSKRPLKILHTADIHLDCDSYGNAQQRQAHRSLYRQCLQTIVERARDTAVDMVLIAGDLFDHNRVHEDTVQFVQEQLQRVQRPVVILPGNHDCLYTNAIYDRYDFTAACDNVRVITQLNGQVLDFPALDLVIWGRAMEEHEPGFHPLAHLPTRHDQRWHIAMAHGFFYETRQEAERSSPIFAEEIRDTGWDYVALGHQHTLTNVSQCNVVAYYSGAPLINWRGDTPNGHVLLLDFSPQHGVHVEPQLVF
jgi:DNA repair exonuclease SbcCD nuclease subunit